MARPCERGPANTSLGDLHRERWRRLSQSDTIPSAAEFIAEIKITQSALCLEQKPTHFSFYPIYTVLAQRMLPAEMVKLCAWGATLSDQDLELWWGGCRLDAYVFIGVRWLAPAVLTALRPYCYNPSWAVESMLELFFDDPPLDPLQWQAIYRALQDVQTDGKSTESSDLDTDPDASSYSDDATEDMEEGEEMAGEAIG